MLKIIGSREIQMNVIYEMSRLCSLHGILGWAAKHVSGESDFEGMRRSPDAIVQVKRWYIH